MLHHILTKGGASGVRKGYRALLEHANPLLEGERIYSWSHSNNSITLLANPHCPKQMNKYIICYIGSSFGAYGSEKQGLFLTLSSS